MTRSDEASSDLADAVLPADLLDRWEARARAVLPGSRVPQVLRACLARTMQRTLTPLPDGELAVITGDIPAMWLRDSSTQMWPYLTLVAERSEGALVETLAGVIRRQLALIAHDPYANAFNVRPDGRAHESADLWGDRPPDPLVWERKYEVDSLCFPVQLAARFVELTGRTDVLGGAFPAAARAIVRTLALERDHEAASSYRFVRPGANALDTLVRDGRGSPVGPTGMTWSGFRPSDDACTYGYNVPANLLAASALEDLAGLWELHGRETGGLTSTADDARALAADVRAATLRHGTVEHPELGTIWAYEVDGLGNALVMDDANLPSLLGLPVVTGVRRDDPLYLRTREFVLSAANPTYTRGSVLQGIGSPHTWDGWVWPIAVATEGLTSEEPAEQRRLLEILATTTDDTDCMHESVDADDARRYTRPWFSWADSMFCQLALAVVAPQSYVSPGSAAR